MKRWAQYREAHAALDTVERVAPDGPISRYYEWYRSSVRLREGDLAAAEPLVRIAIDKAPAYCTPYVHLIVILLGLGREEEALPIIEKVLTINPKLRDRPVIAVEQAGFDEELVRPAMALLRSND